MNLIQLMNRKYFFNEHTYEIKTEKKPHSKLKYDPSIEKILLYRHGELSSTITRKNFTIWKMRTKLFEGYTYNDFKSLLESMMEEDLSSKSALISDDSVVFYGGRMMSYSEYRLLRRLKFI